MRSDGLTDCGDMDAVSFDENGDLIGLALIQLDS